VLFLDEPTTGLDPRGRNEIWDAIRALVAHGTTVLLTTQYLDEADQLADQISVIDSGRVVANDSPDGLKTMIGGDRITVLLGSADELSSAAVLIGRAAGAAAEVDVDARTVAVQVRDRVAALTEVVRALDDAGIAAEDVALRRPTLDEVFLQLTGHADEKAAASGSKQAATGSKKSKKEVAAQ
jgi:ABC-2 type transport system ATP-binding protein